MADVHHILGDYELLDGKPNEKFVMMLEAMLERAKSGDIVGMGAVIMHPDMKASYVLGGTVGGYSMVGALQVLEKELVDVATS